MTTALYFPFRVYRPSCLNRQACDPNHAARPVCTRYEWDDRALRSSYTMRTKCAISDAFVRDCVFAYCASVAQYVYSLSAEHCFRLRNNAISDERFRDCALSTYSVFRPLRKALEQRFTHLSSSCYDRRPGAARSGRADHRELRSPSLPAGATGVAPQVASTRVPVPLTVYYEADPLILRRVG